MKKLTALLFMLMFFANTLVVSAWASSCMHNRPSGMIQSPQYNSASTDDMQGDMPCHHTGKQENKKDHCKGLCLCLHTTVSKTVFLQTGSDIIISSVSSGLIRIMQAPMASAHLLPPRRPPKEIS